MNFYNPYYYMIPTTGLGRGLFSGSVRSGINWSNILNGAQRTLNLVNQAIPLMKQAAPVVRNAKTMFKVMNEFKKVETSSTNTSINNSFAPSEVSSSNESIQTISDGGPTFFA